MDAVECSIKIKSIATTDLSKCILCQKDKKENLTSTENGRCKLQTASKVIQDGLLSHFEEGCLSDIKYHLVCFKPYMLRSERSQNRHEPTAGSSLVDPVTNIDDTLTVLRLRKNENHRMEMFALFAVNHDSKEMQTCIEYAKQVELKFFLVLYNIVWTMFTQNVAYTKQKSTYLLPILLVIKVA